MEDSYRHKGLRKVLIKQLQEKGIRDEQVLAAMMSVPRHFFFDPIFLEQAYQDKAFPIGEGQTISQPYTVAFQTTLLKLKPGEKVFEVGTGSGYQACILLELKVDVYSIEFNKNLYQKTMRFLPTINYHPHLYCGDGSQGLPLQAPFDKILVTAGAPDISQELMDQLKIGGMLVIPVGGREKQKMIRLTKLAINDFKKEEFEFFSFVPLLGKYGW